MPQPLALIGPPGAGKTTIGRLVAEQLERPFIDLDDSVSIAAGRPVPRIFEQEGEDSFRDRESLALKGALGDPRSVIACGGGVVLRDQNVAALKSGARTIYLRVPVEVALQRLSGAQGRPLLTGLSEDRMARLIESRLPLYEAAADVTVEAAGEPALVAAEVARAAS